MVYALDLADPTINPTAKFSNIATLLNVVVPALMTIAGIIFFIMLIYTGFLFMRSDGNPENMKKVKELLKYSLIGFSIIIASYVVIKVIGLIFNIQDIPL